MPSSAVSKSVFLPISFALPLFFYHCVIPCQFCCQTDRPFSCHCPGMRQQESSSSPNNGVCTSGICLLLMPAQSHKHQVQTPVHLVCYRSYVIKHSLSFTFLFLLWNKILYLVTFNFIYIVSLLSSQNTRDRLPNNQWWQKSWPGKNSEQEPASIFGVY